MSVDVTILTGFYRGPFYYDTPGRRLSNRSVAEASEYLRLSPELTRELTAWDAEYQATLNIAVPQDSGFASPEAEHAWIEKGKELAARLRQESQIVTRVDYQADGFYEDGTCVF